MTFVGLANFLTPRLGLAKFSRPRPQGQGLEAQGQGLEGPSLGLEGPGIVNIPDFRSHEF